MQRDETYSCYICILEQCLKHLLKFNLYDLEMILFANAEKECEKTRKSQQNAIASLRSPKGQPLEIPLIKA